MNLLKRHISNIWILAGSIVIALFLYGNTLKNKYCLDDTMVILQNNFTKQGFSGIKNIFTTESFTGFFGEQKVLVAGARYRPLSIASFAVEYAIFDENPWISHFVNILLYAITGVLIYFLTINIFSNYTSYPQFLALLTSLLFLCHPIHTEVIANVKGRDEIFSLLFSLCATWFMILYLKTGGIYLWFGALSWFLALLSKENAFVFLALIPILLYLPAKKKIKLLIKPFLALVGAGLVFVIIRQQVIGGFYSIPSNELMNNSFLGASVSDKYATIFYTLGKYIQLLIFPHPLTYDYYPYHIQLVGWSSGYSIVALIIYCSLIAITVYSMTKNFLITISILLFLIPLLPVSNLLFPIGTFMNERFVYISSLGFCLWAAYLCIKAFESKKFRPVLVVILPIVFALYGYKTLSRNTAWYNDYTLFTTDVKTSVNSAKSNCSAGGIILERSDTVTDVTRKAALLAESKMYLKRAVCIHPTYIDALLLLGNAYFKSGNEYDSAMYYYSIILKINPVNNLAISNMLAIADNTKDVDEKIRVNEIVLMYDPNNFFASYHLGVLYGKVKNNMVKSIAYLAKAVQLNPGSKLACVDLGVAYGITGNFAKSAEVLEKAIIIDPNDPNVFINLGLTYQNLGNKEKTKENFEKAQKLRKKDLKI